MKTFKRRIGVATVAAAIVAGAFSTSQAGVIPWIYDAIFGPAYYGPYAPMSYSVGYMPSPCGPAGCRPTCSPCSSPCSTGKCSPQVSYCNPCEVSGSKCDSPSTSWKAGSEPARARVNTEVITPGTSGTGSRPETYRKPIEDVRGEEILKKPVVDEPLNPPVSVEPSNRGFRKSTSPVDSIDSGLDDGKLSPPVKTDGGAARPLPGLESRATWSVTPATQARSTRKPTFRDASIARRTVEVPATSTTSPSESAIVKK